MEAIRIVEIDGVSVLTHDRNTLNPFSERFNKRYLVNAMDCSIIRDDILSTIHNHFDNHSKDHYVRKRVVPINYYSEIAGVKESKLNVCKICFNHCASNYINQHLKKEHSVKRNFQRHVFRTTGYAIPNQKCGFSYLYREKEDTKPPTSMTTIEGPLTHLRHEDKFLRTINANLYYGKGYPQYLHSENKEESIPMFEAVKKYILQDIPHLKGTHPIYNRMLREGILKVPVLFTTQVIYANYASRFFYTFAKLCDNRIIEEVVTSPTDEVVKRAVMETIEKYIVAEEDTTEMFMKVVIISLMLPDDRFAQSKVRAKIFDGINYFLKLAIADYMLMRNNAKEIIKKSGESSIPGI
ncbi:DEHA2D19448p [Debaryomyces hansenii CBS767]|uniref:DEHA2D19448p n=1 Tax=Debaryomyces hansenii (strain ATCC 36239 / CBS 767 / BCRC 21394 / JCM 1990 / NBRC 0083 / IGC 2968) TaxID=284592 RepID=B5RTP4_DEBHA|nr:DEHA2D19448p [Debaryomyces hansenii CBS767]CAR65729.1 DEHA2D19448p [Debaryomyces hansenii CBS767]|eukprot:XP_002770376.1 DEHA2D19448p [Debaryomyces hansenii CBS767]